MLEKHVIFPFSSINYMFFCELHIFDEYYMHFCNNYMFVVSSESPCLAHKR